MQNVHVLLHPTLIDTHAVRGLASRRQRRREDLERFEQLDLRLLLDASAFEQRRQGPDVVGAEDHVDPRSSFDDRPLVLLREAAADGDLHARMLLLHG